MPTRSTLLGGPRLPLALALALTVVAAACSPDATAPHQPGDESPPLSFAPALVEVTISGIGNDGAMSASVSPVALSELASLSSPSSASSRGSVSRSLSAPQDGVGTGDGTIELEPLSTGSFTQGERTSDGYRYVWATFRVRNAQEDGSAYDTPRNNLTFFAASTASTLGGSAIASMERFDGSAADPAIATGILPTGGVSQVNGQLVPNQADVLQVLSESEAAAVAAPSGVDVLPYGFVVRNATTGGRTLPASPATGVYDGVVTFAFKVPLQSTAAADPFTITALFLAEDDSETRITQSLEEQTPDGEAAFLARATAIGATMKTILPGSDYALDPSDTRMVCTVRTAGTSASPLAYMVHLQVASVAFANSLTGWPLWTAGGVARDLGAVALDADGDPVTDAPVALSFGTPGVLTSSGDGVLRMVPRRDRASTTVSASACGSTSTVTIHVSGFIPVSGGDAHSLALKTDGTVIAWGYDTLGQSSVPSGLTNVVQVSAGGLHSLALESDGTVVAWGDDEDGQATVPSGLTDVVQVAAGGFHSLALKSDGTVVAWGNDADGQATVPTGLTDVVQIAAGFNHSVALESDGTVVAWGSNSKGQTDVPPDLSDVVQIATAGDGHVLALKSDGTVVAWGDDSFGMSTVPAGLTDVVQVAAGSAHSLALKSDGTVVAWGNDTVGQSTVPPSLTDVAHIAAGSAHSLALKSDGTVVAWGRNGFGESTVPAGLVADVP